MGELNYVFEYYGPHFDDKEAVQVPKELARMLDVPWRFYTRFIPGIIFDKNDLPIFYHGHQQTTKNADLFLKNRENECTFSTWFTLSAAWTAAGNGRLLVTVPWRLRSTLGAVVFKARHIFCGRSCFVYIKSDADAATIAEVLSSRFRRVPLLGWLRRVLLVKTTVWCVDLLSVESEAAWKLLQERCPSVGRRAQLVRNCPGGRLLEHRKSIQGARRKQIVAVGRLGVRQKATDILLKAFAAFQINNPDWCLVLVGKVTDQLRGEYEPYLKLVESGVIRTTGLILDKSKLAELYEESMIFAQTSRWESASMSLIEACSFGCVPICTPVGNAEDVLGTLYSKLTFPIDDAHAMADRFKLLAGAPEELQSYSEYLRCRAADYQWSVQLRPVAEMIRGALKI